MVTQLSAQSVFLACNSTAYLHKGRQTQNFQVSR